MLEHQPAIYFVHYWGTGSADKLAAGFKAGSISSGRAGARQPESDACHKSRDGALEIIHDLVLSRAFRDIRPPEESGPMVAAP